MAAALIESLSEWSALKAGAQTIHGQLQNSSEEGMGLTAQLADLQERNREDCSTVDQPRGSVAALTKALDQQQAENVGLVTAAGVQNRELGQQKSDKCCARQVLQVETHKVAHLT